MVAWGYGGRKRPPPDPSNNGGHMRQTAAREEEYQQERQTEYTIKPGMLGMRTKTTKAGKYLEAEIFPLFGVEQGSREKRKGSSAAQKKLNLKNAVRKMQRLMNANFGDGDMLVHLTDTRAQTEDEAKKAVKNWLRRVRRAAEKQGKKLEYIYVMERTGTEGKEKWHCHMVMRGGILSRDEAEKMWGRGLSRIDRYQEQEKGLCGFASYITQRKETQEKVLLRKWACSKGLKRPQATTSDTKFSRRAAMELTKAVYADARAVFEKKYPGYTLVEMPEIRYSDFMPGAYIYAYMRKIA